MYEVRMAIPYSSVHTGAGETAEKCSFAATGVVGSEAVRAPPGGDTSATEVGATP